MTKIPSMRSIYPGDPTLNPEELQLFLQELLDRVEKLERLAPPASAVLPHTEGAFYPGRMGGAK